MRFSNASRRSIRKGSHKFAAAQKPIFFPVEKYGHHGTNIVPCDQPCTFQANRDGAGIVVRSRRAGHGVVMGSNENKWSIPRPKRSHHDIVTAALKGRLVAKTCRG